MINIFLIDRNISGLEKVERVTSGRMKSLFPIGITSLT